MSLLLTLSAIILCFIDYTIYTMADIIDCKLNECQNTIINCSPNNNCSISCTETQSCSGSVINCPLFGDCNIECIGPHSCKYTTINATLSTGNFNLFCKHSTDHCKRLKIYASILETNINNNFNISCNGPLKSCTNSEIQCPTYGNCFVHCNAHTSCKWSRIIGPNYGNLSINCNGSSSCSESIFNAVQSDNINIGCNNQESCYDLSLYCPPNINGNKHCYFTGNHNNGLNLYAINGWNDINIYSNNLYDQIHTDGTMYCGNAYDISCDISSHSWTCINSTDYCNFEHEIETTKINNYISRQNNMSRQNNNSRNTFKIKWWPNGARILFGICVIIIICIFGLCYRYFHNKKHKHSPKHRRVKRNKIVQMNRVKSQSQESHKMDKSDKSVSEISKSTTYINYINDLITNNAISITPMDRQTKTPRPMTTNTTNNIQTHETNTKARGSIDWAFNFKPNSEGYQSDSEPQRTQTVCKSQQNNNQNIIEETEINEHENDYKQIASSNMRFVSRIRGNSQSKSSSDYRTISQIDNSDNDTVKIIESPNNFNNFNNCIHFGNNFNYTMAQIEESDTLLSSESYTQSIEESDHRTLITQCTTRSARTVSTIAFKSDSDDETICQSFVLPSAC